mmetsp:Transcript_134128/g.388285  ORF Transcript_134128/g.388285 Transcript_134128/m.388285 type:complete len:243 (-) Transcript_134128:383-1111(-)
MEIKCPWVRECLRKSLLHENLAWHVAQPKRSGVCFSFSCAGRARASAPTTSKQSAHQATAGFERMPGGTTKTRSSSAIAGAASNGPEPPGRRSAAATRGATKDSPRRLTRTSNVPSGFARNNVAGIHSPVGSKASNSPRTPTLSARLSSHAIARLLATANSSKRRSCSACASSSRYVCTAECASSITWLRGRGRSWRCRSPTRLPPSMLARVGKPFFHFISNSWHWRQSHTSTQIRPSLQCL